jgi:hypothetical protein
MRFGIRKDRRREIEKSRNCGEKEPSLLRLAMDVSSWYLRKKLVGCLQRNDGWILVQIAEAGREVAGMLLIVGGWESFGWSPPEEDSSQEERMLLHLALQ